MPSKAGHRPIKVFWPNVGSIANYPQSTAQILQYIDRLSPSRPDAIHWVRRTFGVVHEFARKLLKVLSAAGVVETRDSQYCLSPQGKGFLETDDPEILFRLFLERVIGFNEILELLEREGPLSPKDLERKWAEAMRPTTFAKNQAPIRYNWLRGFGLASTVAHQIFLTEKGLKLAADARLRKVKPGRKRVEVSHVDLEDKMKLIGEFFEFEAKKRASLNDALPTYALKLREGDRQLDCLWVRYIPFGGKVKFPVEIQLGGNLADTLDRLETVSHYVQRAILVTTQDQEKRIIERLKVKRSVLLDKLTIIFVEDVYKAVEAANVLGALAKRIFPR